MNVRLHALEMTSRANGPGLRSVVWFQGCILGCPGCFNPDTQHPEGGYADDTGLLAQRILANPQRIDGVTFSGGEPFQQPAALLDLVERLASTKLSKLAFSGYTLAELQSMRYGRMVLPHLDVLVAGRYVRSRSLGTGLLGSDNQRIHFLTNRYSSADFTLVPTTEIIVHPDGAVTLTGIAPGRL